MREFFRGAEILEARVLFESRDDWLNSWPILLTTITALIFFADEQGFIGKGVDTEVADAVALGIAVWMLGPSGKLHPLSAIAFGESLDGDWQQYRRVRLRRI